MTRSQQNRALYCKCSHTSFGIGLLARKHLHLTALLQFNISKKVEIIMTSKLMIGQ
jgi:hypothetical protein